MRQFGRPLTITVRYTLEQLRALGILEDNLRLFWYDDQPGRTLPDGGTAPGGWTPLPTAIDRASQTASINTTGAYNETYAYDPIGNMTDKDGVAHAYPAAGNPRPHAPTTVGGLAYTYDANGNVLTGGGRTYTWTPENQPATVASGGTTETYAYDADSIRVKRVRGATTIFSVQGLYEEEASGTTRRHYAFGGQVVAQRERVGSTDTVIYLHADHLGSVAVATNGTGGVVSRQEFTPFGDVRPAIGDITQTTLDYTGQKRDGTGLLVSRRPPARAGGRQHAPMAPAG